MIRLLLVIMVTALPVTAFAVGSFDATPPLPTETTEHCENGQIWDAAAGDDGKGACVDAEQSSLEDDGLFRAARELAHDGQFDHAIRVLAAAQNQNDDRILTYYGFSHRKAGREPLGMAFYRRALDLNPDNILARSYMGQALFEAGKVTAAKEQLAEIRARGGRGTWPEYALKNVINGRVPAGY